MIYLDHLDGVNPVDTVEIKEVEYKIGDIVRKYGRDYVVLGLGRFNILCVSCDGAMMGLNSDTVIPTGRTFDFGKHRFKDFYQNGIYPKDLPSHNYKDNVVNFIGEHGYSKKLPYDLSFYWPNIESFGETSFLWIWPNSAARKKGKAGRTQIKPGKFFRMLFKEDVTDQQIEGLVEKFKAYFSEKTYTLHHGKDRQSFLHAYTSPRGTDHMFDTGSAYKRMCDSCMRYDADHFDLETHPVEAFASGDWGIFWVEDQFGKICARVTYYDKPDSLKQLGPIYATSEQSLEFLKGELESRGDCTSVYRGDWEGARILKIECGDDKVIGPYFDMHSTLSVDGNYLRLDDSGPIEHDHEGTYRLLQLKCDCCEDYVSGVTYVDSSQQDVCEDCLEQYYFTCQYSLELHHEDELVLVTSSYDIEECWAQVYADRYAVVCDHSGDYYTEDAVVETKVGDWVSKEFIPEHYDYCSVDGCLYPVNELMLVGNKLIHEDNVEEAA